MKAAGLCHTDYDSLSWGKPIVMRHEGAGVVTQVGSAIKTFAEGDQVILTSDGLWGDGSAYFPIIKKTLTNGLSMMYH